MHYYIVQKQTVISRGGAHDRIADGFQIRMWRRSAYDTICHVRDRMLRVNVQVILWCRRQQITGTNRFWNFYRLQNLFNTVNCKWHRHWSEHNAHHHTDTQWNLLVHFIWFCWSRFACIDAFYLLFSSAGEGGRVYAYLVPTHIHYHHNRWLQNK